MEKEREVLKLENVWKSYHMGHEQVDALRGVSFAVHEGDYFAVVGPSGSGKSTLMHILGLLDTPTQGKVFIDSIDATKMPEERLASLRGKKIGFIFQSFHLVGSLTALENVALPAMLAGIPEEERLARAKKILMDLGMGDRLHHLPGELSGGQRQRVAIARSLMNSPSLLLADEPTGNLDSASGGEVLKIFDELHKQGKTVIIVTHDPTVASHCWQAVHIKDGLVEKMTGKRSAKQRNR